MLLEPLYLLGFSLVYAGNFTDLGCRLRLLLKHLRKSTRDGFINNGNPRSEEANGYALTTTTKTERLEG
ncbi:hypothetical protein F2Q70_00018585 [Brassica cretica]|uniref:Uncharacterized protein n=1 Tax=Brassica cretica TaxID=69181 RepID=A0A8S9KQR6_BRACR|nr:hypothetical protein F2Q70_00018585 [Brassica cretica]KAF2596769.1 hypothetical protein F2Q68_00012102 [Brassica cretica]